MGSMITGWGAYLPQTELTNAELSSMLDVTEDWILKRCGIRTRHVAGSDESTSTLATAAARAALKRAGKSPEDVDMVIVATMTPDFQIPSAAALVQSAIGATNAGAFDINAGCAGFVYALAQGAAIVDSGAADCVVVCGADVLRRVTDPLDPATSILFSDGAGAVVLEATDAGTRMGPFKLRSEGSHREAIFIAHEKGVIEMNGLEIYRLSVSHMSASAKELLSLAGLTIDDVDLLVAHQANTRILEGVASRLGLASEKIMMNVEWVGNTSAASIPIALNEAAETGRLHDGSVVLFNAFGPGVVWGSGVVRWGTGVTDSDDLALAGRVSD